MALLPWIQNYRETPVATKNGTELMARRKIRGVGAAERALGTAWSRLSSWEKEKYGNQKNYARAIQEHASKQEQNRLKLADEAERERGRQSELAFQRQLQQQSQGLPLNLNSTPQEENKPTPESLVQSRQKKYQGSQTSTLAPTKPVPPPPATIESPSVIPNSQGWTVKKPNPAAPPVQDPAATPASQSAPPTPAAPQLTPQQKLAKAIQEGRVTDYEVDPEELQKRRRERFSRPDPQMPSYTADGQIVRDWRLT